MILSQPDLYGGTHGTIEGVRAHWHDFLARNGKQITPDPKSRTVKAYVNDNRWVADCFAGETTYLTPEGPKRLDDTAGTTQLVLSRGLNGGIWVPAEINEYGTNDLYPVHLRRNGQARTVWATKRHRWLRRHGKKRFSAYTKDLREGQGLDSLIPRERLRATLPSQFGIAHGVVFGDGSRVQPAGSRVQLWGEKDAQLLKFFSESPARPIQTANGVIGAEVRNLPTFFKDRPLLSESASYLYGWLAGYFAADGSVGVSGTPMLCSADRSNLEYVRLVAQRLGIGTFSVLDKERIGYGAEPTPMHSVSFLPSTLTAAFFLTNDHRERWQAGRDRDNPGRFGWRVDHVGASERRETVFCAHVPGLHTFTLEDNLHVGNCPSCGAGIICWPANPQGCCLLCGHLFSVEWPDDRERAEQVLEERPPANRHWKPWAEPIDKLERENELMRNVEARPTLTIVEPVRAVLTVECSGSGSMDDDILAVAGTGYTIRYDDKQGLAEVEFLGRSDAQVAAYRKHLKI